MPFQIPGNVFNTLGIRVGATASWRRDTTLSQQPLTPQTPYVDIVTIATQSGPKFFWTIFDNINADTPGRSFIGSYRGSQWTYLDDYVAVYRDNGNDILDQGDTLVGRFDTGSDWGGLTGDNSQGAIRLLSQTQGEITNRNGLRIDQFSITTPTDYTITPSATRLNEGQRLTTNIRTTGVAAGTTLYYSLSGTGINASDFSSGALTGSATVAANGTLSFAHTLRNDRATEGNESLAIRLFSDANRTRQVGSTATVSIVDTSRAAPTYTITPSATSINEGQTLTTNIRTTGVAAGTTLYYSLSGTGINASDFSSGALTGSATVAANGTLSFAHTLRNDRATEGNESLAINLFTDANRTQRVGNTASVTVVDSSRPPTPTPTPNPITGQITFSDLGTVVSDRVYGKDSRWLQPIVNNTPFTQQDMDRLTNFNIEFEFNNQYIVATAVVRGDTRQPISQYMGSDWTARMVLRGNFSYSGGRLTSASIDSGAVQLISQSTPNSIGSGQLISTMPNLGMSSAPVSDPTNWSSFRRVTSFGNSPVAPMPGLGYSPLSPNNMTATINALQGFGEGRFFNSGWETNPFNSNLI